MYRNSFVFVWQFIVFFFWQTLLLILFTSNCAALPVTFLIAFRYFSYYIKLSVGDLNCFCVTLDNKRYLNMLNLQCTKNKLRLLFKPKRLLAIEAW